MGFVGPVNQRGAMFIRPHDLELLQVPAPEAEEAMIERIVNLGFETRMEMLLADGEQIWAQMTREDADLLELSTARSSTRVRAGRSSSSPTASPGPTSWRPPPEVRRPGAARSGYAASSAGSPQICRRRR